MIKEVKTISLSIVLDGQEVPFERGPNFRLILEGDLVVNLGKEDARD